MGKWGPLVLSAVLAAVFWCSHGTIPTTLDGPFDPVTVSTGYRGHAVDLPDSDPRVQRRAKGFEPEQISVSLSATDDSVYISWITGQSTIFSS